MENQSVDVTTSVRVSDNTAPTLLESAGWASADTIALATHGRGPSRLIAPSVADKILRGGPEAVLIVRAPRSP
jgi:nucleotide-binding universal stress UspA family protein